ncbi:hypothetical protein MN608_11085 [Microdochium nivale]|nr:hypothetical protein MN608_11085 [Microdochium nivale]
MNFPGQADRVCALSLPPSNGVARRTYFEKLGKYESLQTWATTVWGRHDDHDDDDDDEPRPEKPFVLTATPKGDPCVFRDSHADYQLLESGPRLDGFRIVARIYDFGSASAKVRRYRARNLKRVLGTGRAIARCRSGSRSVVLLAYHETELSSMALGWLRVLIGQGDTEAPGDEPRRVIAGTKQKSLIDARKGRVVEHTEPLVAGNIRDAPALSRCRDYKRLSKSAEASGHKGRRPDENGALPAAMNWYEQYDASLTTVATPYGGQGQDEKQRDQPQHHKTPRPDGADGSPRPAAADPSAGKMAVTVAPNANSRLLNVTLVIAALGSSLGVGVRACALWALHPKARVLWIFVLYFLIKHVLKLVTVWARGRETGGLPGISTPV